MPVGQGGMGQVWRGFHREQQVPVAVKVIKTTLVRDEAHLASFRNEVHQMARMDHPHIAIILDCGEITDAVERASRGRLLAGSPYLVMEYAGAGSLADLDRELGWPEIRGILLGLLEALSHAHAYGVIHRDIKPGNILLAHEGDLRPGMKLTDFGLSIGEKGPADSRLVRAGTCAYMAHEQFLGDWRVQGPWTDLYAVGCLAYELVSGAPPFQTETMVDYYQAHLRSPVPALRPAIPVPAPLERWLLRLLEKDPRDRFRHAADARAALEALPDPPARPPATPARWVGAPSGNTTFAGDFDSLVAAERPEPLEIPAPRAPETWRRARSAPPIRLVGAGLGLYGLRVIPMVGRERERDALWVRLRAVARERQPGAVVISGPAGCGKSRLAEWIAWRAAELGAAARLSAFHSPIPGPAHGLGRMLVRALGCQGLGEADARARLAAELSALGLTERGDLEGLARLMDLRGDRASELRTSSESLTEGYARLARLLAGMARERPLVLVLDDVQWGYDALELARHLLANPAGAELPILIIATCRDDLLPDRELERGALRALLRHEAAEQIPLAVLGSREQHRLIEELLFLDSAIAGQVCERSAGIPLFAVQLVGDWIARGVLRPSETGFSLAPGASAEIPDDIHHLWQARLKPILREQPGAGVALGLAAALGQEVDLLEWMDACQAAGAADASRTLGALLAASLAEFRDDGWSFIHGMLRESVQREAERDGSWARLNTICAEMLGPRRGHPGIAERLGLHLLAAGEREASLAPLLEGAEQCLDTNRYARARELLATWERTAKALGLGRRDPAWGRAWVDMLRVNIARGDLEGADALANRAATAARRYRWVTCRYQALRYKGMAAKSQGELHSAEALYLQAQQLAEQAGDASEVARLLLNRGVVLRMRGEQGPARALLEDARDRFHALSDTVGEAESFSELAHVELNLAGDLEAAERCARRALALSEADGVRFNIATCQNALGEILRRSGDLPGARRAYQEVRSICVQLGTPQYLVAMINVGLVMLAEQDSRGALAQFLECRAACGRLKSRSLEVYNAAGVMTAAAGLGDWERFDEELARLEEMTAALGAGDRDLAWCAERAGELAAGAGHRERAGAALALALEQWVVIGDEGRIAWIEQMLKNP